MVDKHVQNVINILKKEHDFYKDLLELSKSKKTIIIEGKVAELDKIVKLEQNMIFDIGQLEKAREQEINQICTLLNMKREEATISELTKRLDNKYTKEMSKLQGLLTDTLRELKDVNMLNGKLIQQSLDYIDYSINIITSANVATGSLYDDITDNKSNTANKKRIFDTKV
ncbi:MAG: flagellar protein FlgN [Bacillota bacterium]